MAKYAKYTDSISASQTDAANSVSKLLKDTIQTQMGVDAKINNKTSLVKGGKNHMQFNIDIPADRFMEAVILIDKLFGDVDSKKKEGIPASMSAISIIKDRDEKTHKFNGKEHVSFTADPVALLPYVDMHNVSNFLEHEINDQIKGLNVKVTMVDPKDSVDSGRRKFIIKPSDDGKEYSFRDATDLIPALLDKIFSTDKTAVQQFNKDGSYSVTGRPSELHNATLQYTKNVAAGKFGKRTWQERGNSRSEATIEL